jgi:hypothetical protein
MSAFMGGLVVDLGVRTGIKRVKMLWKDKRKRK